MTLSNLFVVEGECLLLLLELLDLLEEGVGDEFLLHLRLGLYEDGGVLEALVLLLQRLHPQLVRVQLHLNKGNQGVCELKRPKRVSLLPWNKRLRLQSFELHFPMAPSTQYTGRLNQNQGQRVSGLRLPVMAESLFPMPSSVRLRSVFSARINAAPPS